MSFATSEPLDFVTAAPAGRVTRRVGFRGVTVSSSISSSDEDSAQITAVGSLTEHVLTRPGSLPLSLGRRSDDPQE